MRKPVASPAFHADRPREPPRARPRDRRQALGALGERIAERWLVRDGWRVIARRFRSGRRDVDLIVRRGALVAFVEVKTRRGTGFGDPVEAVHWRKRRELVRSAHCWISRFGRPGEVYRFDVVGVLIGASDPLAPLRSSSEETRVRVRVRHVADAFGVPCSA